MILNKFLGRFEDANRTVRMLLITNLVMAAAISVGFMLASARHERVVLVPQHLTESATVEWELHRPSITKAGPFTSPT